MSLFLSAAPSHCFSLVRPTWYFSPNSQSLYFSLTLYPVLSFFFSLSTSASTETALLLPVLSVLHGDCSTLVWTFSETPHRMGGGCTHTHTPLVHTFLPMFYMSIQLLLRKKTDTDTLTHILKSLHTLSGSCKQAPICIHTNTHNTHTHTAVVVTFVINGLVEFPLLVKKDWNATAGMITNQ